MFISFHFFFGTRSVFPHRFLLVTIFALSQNHCHSKSSFSGLQILPQTLAFAQFSLENAETYQNTKMSCLFHMNLQKFVKD